MRDPALNVALMLDNGWIKDGRAFPFGKAFVDTAWRDASETLTRLDRNGFRVDGPLAAAWASGQGSFACWKTYDELCLATYGLPTVPRRPGRRGGRGSSRFRARPPRGPRGGRRGAGRRRSARQARPRRPLRARRDGRRALFVLRAPLRRNALFWAALAAAVKIGGT